MLEYWNTGRALSHYSNIPIFPTYRQAGINSKSISYYFTKAFFIVSPINAGDSTT